jgi:hypothetical protein
LIDKLAVLIDFKLVIVGELTIHLPNGSYSLSKYEESHATKTIEP